MQRQRSRGGRTHHRGRRINQRRMREASEELDRLFDMYIRNLRFSFGDDAADDHIDSLVSALNESSRLARGDFDDDDDEDYPEIMFYGMYEDDDLGDY